MYIYIYSRFKQLRWFERFLNAENIERVRSENNSRIGYLKSDFGMFI